MIKQFDFPHKKVLPRCHIVALRLGTLLRQGQKTPDGIIGPHHDRRPANKSCSVGGRGSGGVLNNHRIARLNFEQVVS